MKINTLTTCACLLVSQIVAQTTDTPIVSEDVIFKEINGVVAVEAEHFYKQSNHQVRRWYINSAFHKSNVKPDPDQAPADSASGKAYIEVLPDNFVTLDDPIIEGENLGIKTGLAVVHYKVHFSKTGRYYIWSRIRSNDGEDNTMHAGIDGKFPKTSAILQFPKEQKRWFWNNRIRNNIPEPEGQGTRALVEVKDTGVHDIQFCMREDGHEFDKFILTTDSTFQKPVDEGLASQILRGVISPLTAPKPVVPTLWNPDGSIYGANIFYAEKDGQVAFEAENFYKQTATQTRFWHLVTKNTTSTVLPDSDMPHTEGAGEGAYLEVLPDGRQKDEDARNNRSSLTDKGGAMAVLHYPIFFNQAGKYYVWIRGYGVDGDDNTLHVGLDNVYPESGKRVHINKMKQWAWICNQRNTRQKISVDVATKGLHILNLSMREDGCEIDRIWLAQDSTFVPNDTATLPTVIRKGNLKDWLANREKMMQIPSIFKEKDGLLVIEAENAAITEGGTWQYMVDSLGSHTGLGYVRWMKEGQGIAAGTGVLTYRFRIETAGDYQFFMRSQMPDPNNRPETPDPDGNDVWVKFDGGSDVANQTPLSKNWQKIAILGHPAGWTFNTHADKGKPHPDSPICRHFEANDYSFQISGRSKGHAIDRFILKKIDGLPQKSIASDEEKKLTALGESERCFD
jgi:hypothetical protein